MLYRELKEHAGQFRLWLEITAVRPAGSGWAVDLADVAGVSTIECRRVIDCTPECVTNPEFRRNNLTELRLSAAIHADAPEALREWNRPDFLTVRPGRRADELLLTLALPAATPLPEARRRLLELWLARPAGCAGCRMLAIAKQPEYRVRENRREFAPGYRYFNSGSFADALEAIDHSEVTECF